MHTNYVTDLGSLSTAEIKHGGRVEFCERTLVVRVFPASCCLDEIGTRTDKLGVEV